MDRVTKNELNRLEDLRRAAEEAGYHGNNAANALLMNEENLDKLETLDGLYASYKRVRGVFRTGVVVLIIILLYMFYGVIAPLFAKEPDAEPTVTPVVKKYEEYTFTYTMQEIPRIELDDVSKTTFKELRLQAQEDENFVELIDSNDGVFDLSDDTRDELLLFSYSDLGMKVASQCRVYDYSIENGLAVVPENEILNQDELDMYTVTYLRAFNTLDELQEGMTYTEEGNKVFTYDIYCTDEDGRESGRIYTSYDDIKAAVTYTAFDLKLYEDVDFETLAAEIDKVLETHEHTLETSDSDAYIAVYLEIGKVVSQFTNKFTLSNDFIAGLGVDFEYMSYKAGGTDDFHEVTILIKDHAVTIPLYIEYYDLFDEEPDPTPTVEPTETPTPTAEPTKEPTKIPTAIPEPSATVTPVPVEVVRKVEEYTITFTMQQIPKVDLSEAYKTTVGELRARLLDEWKVYSPSLIVGTTFITANVDEFDDIVVWSETDLWRKAMQQPVVYEYSIDSGYLDTPEDKLYKEEYRQGGLAIQYTREYNNISKAEYDEVKTHLGSYGEYYSEGVFRDTEDYINSEYMYAEIHNPAYKDIMCTNNFAYELVLYDETVDLESVAKEIDTYLESTNLSGYTFYELYTDDLWQNIFEDLKMIVQKHTDKFTFAFDPWDKQMYFYNEYKASEDEDCRRVHVIVSSHYIMPSHYIDFYDYFE